MRTINGRTTFDRALEVAVDNRGYPAQLRKLAATGRLEHSAHGDYRVPALASGPHASYAEAVAWSRGRGVISHESALDLLRSQCVPILRILALPELSQAAISPAAYGAARRVRHRLKACTGATYTPTRSSARAMRPLWR
ncbi:hypothetical protein [Antrihabitans stalactiti]|uniref:Uncharacterized protein n=1 Tax=Antrihabitans stalactiti TaxID=2584121 RepID=A0A848KS59_9NOCA|nr:hypothetical protein [Antrihabitans stalactiti]NMN99100.1 hypothetical protein [Antrihabitans stalactiti]